MKIDKIKQFLSQGEEYKANEERIRKSLH